MSDVKPSESDVDNKARKKKNSHKKLPHVVNMIPPDYTQNLSRCTDKVIVEKHANPTEQMLLEE